MNTFKRIFENNTPFSPSTGTCKLVCGDIVCDRTGKVVVEGVFMTDALVQALHRSAAMNGEISMDVTDKHGRVFPAIIQTEREW